MLCLDGIKSEYKVLLELLCLKADEFTIDDIEVKISAAINDTTVSRQLDYLVENLFELQGLNRSTKLIQNSNNEINPSELESFVINAIKKRDLLILHQDVYSKDEILIKECFVKLKTVNGKIIHPKDCTKVLYKHRLMMQFDLIVLEKNIQLCR